MPTRTTPTLDTIVDDLLPVYDVSDGVALVVDADVDRAWDALLATDLVALGRDRPVVGLFGMLRMLPELVWRLVRGQPIPRPPRRLTLQDTTTVEALDGGWVRLAEGPHLLALGMVGTFWRPVIRYAAVSADDFRTFAEPGYARTVYALAARPLAPGKTLLAAVMRTATTDERSRRWFRRYWTLGVGSGAHVLVASLLAAARDRATGVDTVEEVAP